jgi:putative acetyltransferase
MISAIKSQPALRPYLPADAPLLAEIFRASVGELAAEDYNEAQQAAWISAADDQGFAKRLANELTIVATIEGGPVGFASVKSDGVIDMLYVHPSVARRGVASLLCEALEKLAAGRGAKKLSADASDNALGFFTNRGYVAERRNAVRRNGEWLATTTVSKPLSSPGAALSGSEPPV